MNVVPYTVQNNLTQTVLIHPPGRIAIMKPMVQTYIAASLQKPVNRVFGFERENSCFRPGMPAYHSGPLNPGNRKSEAVKK